MHVCVSKKPLVHMLTTVFGSFTMFASLLLSFTISGAMTFDIILRTISLCSGNEHKCHVGNQNVIFKTTWSKHFPNIPPVIYPAKQL